MGEEVTREILWNIGTLSKAAMYGLFVVSMGFLLYGLWGRIRFWQSGTRQQDESPSLDPAGVVGRIVRHVLLEMRIKRLPSAWVSHMALFFGFIVLFIGTVLVAIEHYHIAHFFYGRFYLVASLLLDLFGLGFVVALVVAMGRRGFSRVKPSSKPIDAAIVWLLLLIGLTGFAVEGLRIAYDRPEFETASFVGWVAASAFQAVGLEGQAVRPWHVALWWVHMVAVFVFLAMVPYTKLLHFLVAPLNIAISPEQPTGRLKPVSLEAVEQSGRFGVEKAADFTQRQLLSFDACTHCRRCEEACPAFATDKPLSPMRVVHDIARASAGDGSLHGDVISAETLWSCTTCGACVYQCPVLIHQLEAIVDMRRFLVGEGQVLGSAQAALRSIAATGNPWGLPQDERADWAEGLDIPTIDEKPEPEVLLWVGCAGSYDRRNQQVTRSLAKILAAAEVPFAILGTRERCTGDPCRRLGDEFTFMELAEQNVQTLNQAKPKRIVTQCAHCFNTLRNEYPDFGGSFDVVHHTQFIQELIDSGRLKLRSAEQAAPVAIHDPCYVARHNRLPDPPRRVLASQHGAALPIVEPEHHGEQTFCCGAGGGRMWMEEDIDKRVNFARWEQLKRTGAQTVATGCPYCMTMLDDASKNDEASGLQVKDVAELIAERLPGAAD